MTYSIEYLSKTAAKLRQRANGLGLCDTIPIKAATLRLIAEMLDQAATDGSREEAWEEGYQASISVIATGDLASNPYREDPQ